MTLTVTCPKCGNADQDKFRLDVTHGRPPSRTNPGAPAILNGFVCGVCGTKIPGDQAPLKR